MSKEYGMFTKEGNQLVDECFEAICQLPIRTTNEQLIKAMKLGFEVISEQGYEECFDSDVRERFTGAVERITGRNLSMYW